MNLGWQMDGHQIAKARESHRIQSPNFLCSQLHFEGDSQKNLPLRALVSVLQLYWPLHPDASCTDPLGQGGIVFLSLSGLRLLGACDF